MIRVLVLIAVTGFLVSVVSLSTAVAIGGSDAISRGVWFMGPHTRWGWDSDEDHHFGRHGGDRIDGSGPQTTRELTWTGGDSLEIDIPADVRFTQASSPGQLVVTGPKGSVEQVVVEGGRLRFDRRVRDGGRLTVVMSAPDVTRFDLGGANRLTIEGYSQDRLEIELSGSSEVTAKGRARAVELEVSGSSDADLGALVADSVEAEVGGSGKARLAPKESIAVDISGSGDVTLLTVPPKSKIEISGAGRVHTPDTPSVAPPAAPIPGRKL